MKRTHSIVPVVTLFLLVLIAGSEPVAAQLGRSGAWGFGPSYALDHDQDRDLVYLSSGGVVRIVDVGTLANPDLVADLHTHGLVENVFYDSANQRLYLACGEGGMEIWDVSIPATPALLSRTEILYVNVETPVGVVEAMGNIAVAECGFGYVHTLDVSDPTAPVQVAFNGTMGNPAHDLSIGTGGQVHTTGAQYYVRMAIDGSGNINTTGSRDFDFGAGAVFGTPDVAYVGYGSSMVILDLHAAGFLPWSVTNVGGIAEIDVEGTIAYLVNNGGFRIYDVSTYNAPSPRGSIARDYVYDDLVVTPPYAYIAASHEGLDIVDVTDPNAPAVEATFRDVYGGASASEVRGGLAYVAGLDQGLLIVDTHNLESVEIGRADTPGSTYDVALDGDLAYLADTDGGLRIVDVSSPTEPTEIGFVDAIDAWRVTANGDAVYVIESIVNQPYLLHTIDVSTPSAPTDLGSLPLPGSAWGSVVSGDLLFVAADDGGVMVYDVSVPLSPSLLTTYPIADVTEVDVAGDVLYVASFEIGSVDGGLYVLDVSDPMMPTQLAHVTDPGYLPFHVHVDGDFAYTSGSDEVELFDVSNPSNPVLLDTYVLPWTVFDLTTGSGIVYVSDGHAGLQAVENSLWLSTPLFSDGFESGDASRWSAATP